MNRKLPVGLYEAPLTRQLAAALAGLAGGLESDVEALDAGAGPQVFARWIHDLTLRALRSFGGDDRLERQLALVNSIVERLTSDAAGAETLDLLEAPARELRAIVDRGPQRLGALAAPPRPQIPLRTSDLLVNGPRDLRLAPEVRRELASADRVDLLISFLKWSGVRVLLEAFSELLARRPGGLRVLTTAYLGATDPEALEALAERGAQIRVSYDLKRTRLHAKAWLFHRESEFSTGFVGSSNLSAPAILDGLEWNVRLSAVDNRALLDKFVATFEQYWQDGDFAAFDAVAFRRAVRAERTKTAEVMFLALRPYPHQEEILDALAAERAAGHHRNLVVSATGTGKTLVAAFDFGRLLREEGAAGSNPGMGGPNRLSLLFVAHRQEILEQARTIYRHVLRDGSFGELLVGGQRPVEGRHVFAAIQSLHEDRLATLAPDAYDVVVVDEFHHAAASTYERLLTHLRPRYLLGLTATPERTDGQSVLGWFDGRIAAELRLWGALDRGLLSPFQYFGIADETDLSRLRWQAGRYVTADLENLYTGNDRRAALILQALRDKVRDPGRMRAFGFCASVEHARFMARKFSAAGLVARAVHADSNDDERREALFGLRDGRVQAVFTVDLFNEGVDLPAVDTVLFLRPTESATVFLQQLGRGLRLDEGKECLTVLDFIGNAHARFRFDVRYRALLGGTRREVARQVEEAFPRLPAGCSAQLDRQAQEWVLGNIRRALDAGWRGLTDDLLGLGDVPLAVFLEKVGTSLEELYRGGRCWSELRRAAGLAVPVAGSNEAALARSLSRLLHIDDDDRLDIWRLWLMADEPPPIAPLDSWEGRLQAMLFAALGHVGEPLGALSSHLADVWAHPAMRSELVELLALLADRRRKRTPALTLDPPAPAVPLRLHASYSLDEIMAAFGVVRSDKIFRPRGQGVWFDEATRSDLLFVTLEKTEQEYSSTTLYADYPLSPSQFHWESQNSAAPWTAVGRRYLDGSSNAILFVRMRRKDDRGVTVPYLCLGRVRLHASEGERPMRIVWQLDRPAPAGWFEGAKIAAA